jgi:hypothetical protein
MPFRRFYRRRFLNRRGYHAGAYVLADCQIETYRPQGGNPRHSIDAYLIVGDCGRVSTLDFCIDSEAQARNALYKARLLRDVLVDFTDALESAVEERRGPSDTRL